MAIYRRRHQNNIRFRYLVRTVVSISGALLFLFALISFFAPSPVENDHLHRHQHPSRSSTSLSTGIDGKVGFPVFHVPTSAGTMKRNIWSTTMSKYYYGCSNASSKFHHEAQAITQRNRYLSIATSGGLNQQRTGITDAVVAARILNATLVVPKLDQKSFWKDASNFSEIFDVDWFISHLSRDVKIIKELPRRGGKTMTPYRMRVPRKCNERCYQIRVLPVLLKKRAVQLSKFDYRLANRLETDLQKLRCRVNYHALKFTDPIIGMGKKLVNRMRKMSKHYVALHLRFEPDMLAFSGCYYGGGEKEIKDLGKIRKRWKTLHDARLKLMPSHDSIRFTYRYASYRPIAIIHKFSRFIYPNHFPRELVFDHTKSQFNGNRFRNKSQISNPDKVRRQGRCPLTPEEVGLMLRALGYDKDVHIYVASGEVYGGEETLAPLKALFPNIHSKDTLAKNEELAPFSAFSSRMAALDFIMCDESDVFATNNNGNMAKILAGRRRYFGHKPTIRPNAKKLYRLFLNRENMTWGEFSSRVRTHQRGFMGEPKEVRPGRGEFHENPSTCICEIPDAKANMELEPQNLGNESSLLIEKDKGEVVDDQNSDYEPELSDHDEEEEFMSSQFQNATADYDVSLSEEPELEELVSD